MQNSLKQLHEQDVKYLSGQVSSSNQTLSLAKESLQSNTTRSSEYKNNTKKLHLERLNRILEIDHTNMVALVEPRVSMKQLAHETFKQGVIPLVVPEFKGITIGGAIMGCGGESSSHKYGLFHDCCNYFEILTGSGEVVHASPAEHSDLFDALAGSYGSLGVLLSAEVRLQKAQPWVTIQVHRFTKSQDAVAKIDELMRKNEPPEYLEGIVYSEGEVIVLEGNQTDVPCRTVLRDSPFSPWYYTFVQNQLSSFSMPLLDYLFRYDRGAFWMGSYVLWPPILTKLFCEGIYKIKDPVPFSLSEQARYSQVKAPSSLVLPITYPFTSSQTLFKLLHSCEDWVKDRFIVQDFTLPISSVDAFIAKMNKNCPIYPLWLCPLKAAKSTQIFAPNSLGGADSINIGIYGVPNGELPVPEALKWLEIELHKHNGRKWLYTHSHYTIDQFWSIYEGSIYHSMRQKYNADKMWLSIENKVLS